MKKTTKRNERFPLAKPAETAFKEAVGEVIEEHARLGLPLYVGREGKAVELPPEEVRKRAGSLEALRPPPRTRTI